MEDTRPQGGRRAVIAADVHRHRTLQTVERLILCATAVVLLRAESCFGSDPDPETGTRCLSDDMIQVQMLPGACQMIPNNCANGPSQDGYRLLEYAVTQRWESPESVTVAAIDQGPDRIAAICVDETASVTTIRDLMVSVVRLGAAHAGEPKVGDEPTLDSHFVEIEVNVLTEDWGMRIVPGIEFLGRGYENLIGTESPFKLRVEFDPPPFGQPPMSAEWEWSEYGTETDGDCHDGTHLRVSDRQSAIEVAAADTDPLGAVGRTHALGCFNVRATVRQPGGIEKSGHVDLWVSEMLIWASIRYDRSRFSYLADNVELFGDQSVGDRLAYKWTVSFKASDGNWENLVDPIANAKKYTIPHVSHTEYKAELLVTDSWGRRARARRHILAPQ